MSKITKKLIEIRDFRGTRSKESDKDFMVTITSNLLSSLSDRSNFFYKQLDQYKLEKKEIDKNLKIAMGLYICSLITCWETFFRDLFIFICNYDVSINNRLSAENQSEIPLKLTIGEFLARKYNFQNLSQTREAFDLISEKETEEFSEYFSDKIFNGVISEEYALIFKWNLHGELKAKIDETLFNAFNIRHRVTHDANYLIEHDITFLKEVECVLQMIPQFFASHFAVKYSQNRTVFNIKNRYVRKTNQPTKDEIPYIFNVKDFTSNDWEIVKKETEGV